MSLAVQPLPFPARTAPAMRVLDGGGAAPASPRAETLARLRALVGPVRVEPGRLSCGLEGLDAWLGGWPGAGVVEVVGEAGSGRLAVVLPALAGLTRRGREVLVVDPLQQFHPPGGGGLDLERVVLVRPPLDQAAWVVEQVARSGAVEAVLALDLPALGRQGWRLERAAEAGSTTVFRVHAAPDPELPAALRLRAEGWEAGAVRVRCLRSRDGRREGLRRVEVA